MSATRPNAGITSAGGLTHVDEHGKAHMVDVTGKPATHRIAEARCTVRTLANVTQLLSDPPGVADLLASARFAGIMAAKQTSVLIPLCHPIRLDAIDVGIRAGPDGFEVAAVAAIIDRTGVEMEALTACTAAALVLVQRCGRWIHRRSSTTSPCGTSRVAGRGPGNGEPAGSRRRFPNTNLRRFEPYWRINQ